MLHDEQGGGGDSRREKEDAFGFDPTGIREVFHILKAAAVPGSAFGTLGSFYTISFTRVVAF
jgi:hypothetical protein